MIMAEENLPERIEKLDIGSQSLLESETQHNLESLSLLGDECPRESCKCNARLKERPTNPWNVRHVLGHKTVFSSWSISSKGGIIKRNRFKSGKSWILRAPILKLNPPICEDQGSTSLSVLPVQLDSKISNNTSSESMKTSSELLKTQGTVFGSCSSIPQNDFSLLFPTKSQPAESMVPKLFTATSYRRLRCSANVSPAMNLSKVFNKKKELQKDGSLKSRAVSDSTNTYSARQPLNQLAGSQSTSCSQQARMVGPSHVSGHGDDVTIDELASYFDLFVHIPRKMSHMAENMYI